MAKKFKKKFYFLVAAYFVFWAKLVLYRWRPKIILITGSTGKTTLFYLLKAQLGEQAEFAENANSAFGIPFHILGLKRKSFAYVEWLKFIFFAPLLALQSLQKRKKIYVVEADSDRPGEAKIIANLLEPNIVLMTNIFKTHAVNFEPLLNEEQTDILSIIADEFATYAAAAKDEVWANGDDTALVEAIIRAEAREKCNFLLKEDYLDDYQLTAGGTSFMIAGMQYDLQALLPEEVWLSLAMVKKITEILGTKIDQEYRQLVLPPGRSSVFAGIKNTTLIDSTYNANLGSMLAVLKLFEQYQTKAKKWLVLGHLLEEGTATLTEHQELAKAIVVLKTVDRLFLLGEENQQVTLPMLKQGWSAEKKVEFFTSTQEALTTITAAIQGEEVILFKGAPFLEGMIEQLLADKTEATKLVRREPIWQKRRQNFYA